MEIRSERRGHRLEIRRRLEAPPERVFEAFRNPALLRRWAVPGEHRTESVAMDFRVGGRYRREIRFPDGSVHALSGEYLQIEPPRRLAYTFRWETFPGFPETRVEVELLERQGGTELRIVHTGFETSAEAGDHEAGWDSCLDRLEELLA